MYKQLWLIVEGVDDIRFCERVIMPLFDNQYNKIQCWSYANRPRKDVINFLRSIHSVSSWDYILFGDINNSPCITAKKTYLFEKFEPNLDKNKTIVVVKEIEGWYLAGIDSNVEKELGLKSIANTNNITKEEFNQLMPAKFDRVDFMVELLERFNANTAKQKNRSFEYFTQKYGL